MSQPELGIKKMKQGMSYTCKEKTIILNVFKYFKQEFPDIRVTEVVRRTAKATGCSEKSVFQFRKEEASAEGFKEPSKTKVRKNININSRDIKYDSSVRQAIRKIIYDLKFRDVVPSLSTIRKQINNNECLPNFSLMTLRRLLFDMGFCYEKNGNKSVLVEKQGVENKVGNTQKCNSNGSKKLNCNNKMSTGDVQVSINNVSDNKPQIVPMQVVQNNVNHLLNEDNRQDYHRLPMYVRHTENINNVSSIHHNVPLMVNHRNDIVSHYSGTVPMRHCQRDFKYDMNPWMEPLHINK